MTVAGPCGVTLREAPWRARFALSLVVAGVIATAFWIILLCALLLRLLVAEVA
jgi:hypothetical protein